MIEIICLSILILFFCSTRTKKGIKKGVSDSLETGTFLLLKGNQIARSELASDFESEFERLLEETPPTRNQQQAKGVKS